jgi:hypothetical protein
MKFCTSLSLCILLAAAAVRTSAAEPAKVRLFILSGQSNMVGLQPQVSFTPALEKAFPGDEIIVVKDAAGGQPILRWYKKWQPPEGPPSAKCGDMTVVVGRLSDNLKGDKGWEAVRAAQVQVAEADPLAAWVDTDDLNGPKDGLHYDKAGYAELGKRFAEKTIGLLKKAR